MAEIVGYAEQLLQKGEGIVEGAGAGRLSHGKGCHSES